MKKILLALVSLLLLSDAYAQKNNGLLWEVSGKGLKESSYIFGTYHLAGKTLLDSLPEVSLRFNKCKAVVGEMIMDSTMAMKLMPYMMSKDNETLDKVFTADEYKTVAALITDVLHADASFFNRFKPSAVAIIITASAAPKNLTATNPPMDMYFQQEGKRRDEKVIGLETLEQQADFLLNEPLDAQKKQLLAIVKKKDEMAKSYQQMYSLYRQQDLDGLKALIEKEEDTSPNGNDKLLKNRNLNWLSQLPAIMQQQPTFIAVGAAHLIGDFGLVNQLRLKGYTVKAVKI